MDGNNAIEVRGADKVVSRLQRKRYAAEDMTAAMRDIGVYMLGSIDRNFREQGRPQPWPPLSPVTLQLREHGGTRILEDTGQLRASITYRVRRDGVEIGTNVHYARKQQFGDPNNLMFGRIPAPIPPRPFLVIQDEDRKVIMDIVKRHIRRA